jgi:hypothetical protein
VIQFTSARHEGAEDRRLGDLRSANWKQGPSEMDDTALSALGRAWATTTVAIFLLVAGLTLARAWDTAMYVQGFEEVLKLDE